MKNAKIGFSRTLIFPYMDRIAFSFPRIWTDSPMMSKYGKIRIKICPYNVRENTDQRKPVFRHILHTSFLCRFFVPT